MEAFYQHKDIQLFYRKIGTGKTKVIAYHGFTRSSEDYLLFEDFCKEKYTIYAIDLFYHGKTTFNSKLWKSFSKGQLREILEGFLEHIHANVFELIGYSMGGRVALFTMEQFANRINHVYLLAPDGLKINFWNWLVTSTKAGKGIYGLTISNPGIVYGINSTGQKLNLLPSSMNKFLDINFKTKGMRLRVYRVWQLYRFITFKQSDLKRIIKKNRLSIDLVIGHKDPVVPPKMVKDFAEYIGSEVTLHSIRAGHDLFRPHVLDYLKKNVF
ncbi:MAG: hypothetical protein CMP61_10875 [Flavobacteriales bacterium]|nr:hypothetical protein [Flavobacteriales bacterium]